MKIHHVASFGSPFTQTVIKSASNVKLVEDSITFMSNSNCKRTGGGLMYSYRDGVYMLTCSHIFPKGNKSVYFCSKNQFDMYPFLSLKEMDIEIFKCDVSSYKYAQFNVDEYLSSYRQGDGEYKLITPTQVYDMVDVGITHESNVSPLYPQVPTITGKIPSIKPDDLCGISGSVVCVGEFPIGIVSNYDIDNDVVKCIHIPFVLSFAQSMISRQIEEIQGIHISADLCEIEYTCDPTLNDAINTHAYCIINNSREYPGTDGIEILKKDNFILTVNGNKFNSSGLINCSDILNININISLSAYLMISATLINTVSYYEMSQNDTASPIIRNIKGLPYDIIHKITPRDNLRRVIWKNYIFCEMSTELIYNYESNGMTVSDIEKDNIEEYYEGKRRVILLTYVSGIVTGNKKNATKCKYKFPRVGNDGKVYFMTLIKVGKWNVRDINHLYKLLSSYKKNEAVFIFSTPFKLSDRMEI